MPQIGVGELMGTDREVSVLSKLFSQERWPYLLTGLFLLNIIVKTLPLVRGIMIHPDAPTYLWSAQALDAGNVEGALAAYPMLFYPFLIMLVHKIGIDWLWAGRLISVIASCVALLPFVAIGKKFSTGWPLLVVTLLFILLPEYNFRAYAVLRDPLYICLTLFCLYYALRFLEERSLEAFFYAISISFLLPLLRIEGALTSLLVNSWCIILFLCSNEKNKKIIIALALACASVVSIIFHFNDTFSLVIRLQSFTENLNKFSHGNMPVDACLKALSDISHNLPFSTNGSNFWQVIQRHWLWIYIIGMLYVMVKILGWLVLFLSTVGVLCNFKKIDSRKIFLVSVFFVQFISIMIFYLFNGFLEVRFMLLPAIILLFFLLFSLESMSDLLYEKLKIYFSFERKYVLIIFSCFLVLPYAYDSFFNNYNIHIPVLKEACLWAKNEILKEQGAKWFVSGNARRMAWFLERSDIEQFGEAVGYEHINARFSEQGLAPALFVLMLNKRVPGDVEMVDFLSKKYPQTSKVFAGHDKDKHIVIAVWNVAGNLNKVN